MKARACRRTSKPRGASLLELLLVVALVAAMSLVAAAAVSGGFRGMQLRSLAGELAAQLRFTRAQAIVTGLPQRFEIDPVAHAWRGAKQRSGSIPEEVQVTFLGARQVQPAEGVGAIIFFADGAATGGRIRLTVERATWNIDVAWLTGEVTVQRIGDG